MYSASMRLHRAENKVWLRNRELVLPFVLDWVKIKMLSDERFKRWQGFA